MRPSVKKLIQVTLIGLFGVCVSACDGINERLLGEKVALAAVPPAVKATIELESKGASVKEVVRFSKDGKPVYAAHILANGKEQKTLIGEDGKVVERDSDDDDD
jgi:hypothetical protein